MPFLNLNQLILFALFFLVLLISLMLAVLVFTVVSLARTSQHHKPRR